MLYLEDYLELIEHLPQETVDRLTDMRELDLQVQNSLDNIDKRTYRFFQNACQAQLTDLETEHEVILKEYKKILEDAEEKVQLANTMSDSLGKYMRRLDQDILKFKTELESDNCGITEIIEKRVDEPEESLSECSVIQSVQRNTRRHSYHPYNENANKYISTISEPKKHDVSNVEQKFQRLSMPDSSPSKSQVIFSVDQMGAGGSAIAAAASQAIAATQQMQQGRRTASLKASYEAINTSSNSFNRSNEVDIVNKELAGAAQTAIAAVQQTHRRRRRRRGQGHSNLTSKSTSMVQQTTAADFVDGSASVDADPDEIRYCLCNEIAFGDMVACDNANCPYEWYHYPCVGITEAPEGKWYCPQCTVTMKRRHRRSL